MTEWKPLLGLRGQFILHYRQNYLFRTLTYSKKYIEFSSFDKFPIARKNSVTLTESWEWSLHTPTKQASDLISLPSSLQIKQWQSSEAISWNVKLSFIEWWLWNRVFLLGQVNYWLRWILVQAIMVSSARIFCLKTFWFVLL